jgi:CspA family cold shock protein
MKSAMTRGAGERLTGQVKWFDAKKGFGFIERADGSGDLFVHHSDVDMTGFRQLQEGETVEFEVGEGKKGPKAVRCRVVMMAAN